MDVSAELARLVPTGRVITDPGKVGSYLHDEAEWAPYGRPAAVVRPRSTAEVREIVRYCARRGVPVVPRGAGTGLSGGANALEGCVVVSTEAMDRIIEIDRDELLAVVQPGVVTEDLRTACAERGVWYPPDPASAAWATIGGNVATNAGGICCVKYGVTRDYVLGLEAVVGRGEIVRLGHRTAKGVAGYDLCGLLVGSEGTLGLITEVTLRLRPARPPEQTVVGSFDSLVAAGEAVRAVIRAGILPSALELIDRHCLRAVEAWQQLGLTDQAEVLLLGRSDVAGATEAETILACFHRAGAERSSRSTNPEEAEALFTARRLAYPALERLGPVLTEDVCVPRTQVPAMLARIEQAASDHRTLIANIAHAGDGNLHPLIIAPADDENARRRAQAAFDQIMTDALALGGTVTGEHGVGLLKREGLRRELAPEVLALHRAVKHALDPATIFNPTKIFTLGHPDDRSTGGAEERYEGPTRGLAGTFRTSYSPLIGRHRRP